MTDDVLRTPRHLRKATKAWFRRVTGEYELDEHHVKLLILACEAWDRCQQARERIDADGLTVADRFGQIKAHPCAAIERDSRIAFARLLRELGLDVTEPAEAPRSPVIHGNAGLRAVEGA